MEQTQIWIQNYCRIIVGFDVFVSFLLSKKQVENYGNNLSNYRAGKGTERRKA